MCTYEIAILEDDDILSKVMTEVLRQMLGDSLTVCAFPSVYAFEHSTCVPDSILLDLNLIDSVGMDTVRRVQMFCKAPIVVLTGHSEYLRHLKELGIPAYEKPNGYAAAAAIAEAIRYKHYQETG